MASVTWNDSYLTGHPMVDRQHQELFVLVNKLHQSIIEGHGRDAQGPVLKRLANYTVEHFRMEERVMQEHNYPGYSGHKTKHDQLAAEVKQLIDQFDAGKLVLPLTLSGFLANWISHHIDGEDKRLIAWLRQHQMV